MLQVTEEKKRKEEKEEARREARRYIHSFRVVDCACVLPFLFILQDSTDCATVRLAASVDTVRVKRVIWTEQTWHSPEAGVGEMLGSAAMTRMDDVDLGELSGLL